MTPITLPRGRLPVTGIPWVTWRQHRAALLGLVALFGGLGLLLLSTGLAMHAEWGRLGLDHCPEPGARACAASLGLFDARWQPWAQFLPRFLTFLPAVVGVFVGTPVVARELESGTFRFAWTQGRSRLRWAGGKLLLLGAAITGLSLAFSAAYAWWFGPWYALMGRMSSGQTYEVAGLVFAARTLFAFCLGAMLGAVIRRTVPAMAATAVGWLAIAWPTTLWLRPRLQAPVAVPENILPAPLRDWTLSSWYQDAAGHHVTDAKLTQLASQATGVPDRDTFSAWLTEHGYTSWVDYQPDSRFWHFQAVEASGYVVVALLLATATLLWIRNHAS